MSRKGTNSAVLLEAKRLLGRYGLRPRKALGQHFLIDEAVLGKIVDAADITGSDTVVEVGPGLGLLTAELVLKAGRVLAIEKDERMAELLRSELTHEKLTILSKDMLQLDPAELPLQDGFTEYKVVANLPYYAAAPIIRRFLETPRRPRLMVVLLQREVAQSLVSESGRMSIFAVATQMYATPTMVATVYSESFYPMPKVNSAILRLDVRDKVAVDVEPEAFFEVVRAGFSAPRKQLANSLSVGLAIDRVSAAGILQEAGISAHRRAETLSLIEWAALTRKFHDLVRR